MTSVGFGRDFRRRPEIGKRLCILPRFDGHIDRPVRKVVHRNYGPTTPVKAEGEDTGGIGFEALPISPSDFRPLLANADDMPHAVQP
jgi:hypothetical protein